MTTMELDQFLANIAEKMQVVTAVLDRLLLESELRSASRFWERTFDGMNEPVAILRRGRGVLRHNRHFAGRPSQAKCFETFAGLDGPCDGCPFDEALRGREHRHGLVRRGRETFEVHSYPILEEGEGEVSAVVNHYVDLTPRLMLQEQMIQSEKMAALGYLAGHIAHELNNPLAGIRGLVQVLLQASAASEQMKGDLLEVEKATRRSQEIISSLLKFAQEGDDLFEVVDLNELVQMTLPLLKTAMSAHHYSFLPFHEPARARVIPALLRQVIFNLIKNACQAMPDGGELEVAVEQWNQDTMRGWVVRVTDQGMGMSPETMEKIFDPLFTTKTEAEGTGLGLSLSKRIVERMGGRIEVESALGVGTTMRVILSGTL